MIDLPHGPVTLGPYPYPYQAAFSVSSDIDSANLARLRAVHALFCGNDLVRRGTTSWQVLGLSPQSRWYDKQQDGITGLGLPLADSFFLVGDPTTLGMYRYQPQHRRFIDDEQHGENCAAFIRLWLQQGRIDSFHAFLHYTRAQIEPLLTAFYHWCEQEAVTKPSVWLNHSAGVTPTGLCPRSLQPNRLVRCARLAARNLLSPILGCQPYPLSRAWVRYEGATPGSPYYINDLLANNGLRFVWLNTADLHRDQICLPTSEQRGRRTILQPLRMDDGTHYYRFARCYGGTPTHTRDGLYLAESRFGIDSSQLITEANLKHLCDAHGTCILHTHWTHPRSMPISDDTIARFHLLRRWQQQGKIWLAATSKLLEWTRRITFLDFSCSLQGPMLCIEIHGVADPLFGTQRLQPEELDGLCFKTTLSATRITVAVGGHALSPAQVQRAGDWIWLNTSGQDASAPNTLRQTVEV
jgi:hypothetical protein